MNLQSASFGGDPDQLLLDQNIYNPETGSGVYVRRDSNDSDSFYSNIEVSSGYVSEEFKFTDWFSAIAGLRFEKFALNYTGQNQSGAVLDNATVIDKSDFFPSANLIFDLNKDGSKK